MAGPLETENPHVCGPPVRVSDGTRTHDRLDHNQELYQLSYAHRGGLNLAADGPWQKAWSPPTTDPREPARGTRLTGVDQARQDAGQIRGRETAEPEV